MTKDDMTADDSLQACIRYIESDFRMELQRELPPLPRFDHTNHRPGRHRGGPPIGTLGDQMQVALNRRFREDYWHGWADDLRLGERPSLYRSPRGARPPDAVEELTRAAERNSEAGERLSQLAGVAVLEAVANDRELARALVNVLREAMR